MKILHRGFLYEAWTIADIKNKYESAIVSYLEKYSLKPEEPEKLTQMVDAYLNHVNNADPSHDKKYLGAITKWALSKRPEDLDTQIKPYLGRFYKLLTKNPGKLGNISKNIAKGKLDLDGFKETVNKLEQEDASGALDHGTADSRIRDKVGSFPKVGENDKYVCFKVDAWESKESDDYGAKHFCFSGKVDWCVKYRDAFDQYEPPYYYFLSKEDGSEFALMHIKSMQLKDTSDSPLTRAKYLQIKDIVWDIIKDEDVKFEEDFVVIIDSMSQDEFKSLVGEGESMNMLKTAFIDWTPGVINKIFECYPDIVVKLDVSTSWVLKDRGYLFHELNNHSIKCMVNNIGFPEEEIAFVTLTENNADNTPEFKVSRIKFLIDECRLHVNQELAMHLRSRFGMLPYSIERDFRELFDLLMSYDNIDVNIAPNREATPLYESIRIDSEYGDNLEYYAKTLIAHPKIELDKLVAGYSVLHYSNINILKKNNPMQYELLINKWLIDAGATDIVENVWDNH